MRTTQGRMLESLRAVLAFLVAYADKLVGIIGSGQHEKLVAMVGELEGYVSAQSGSGLSSKGATQKHVSLRKALVRDHMAPIAKIAAAELPQTPEIEPLKVPRGTPSFERLRAAALGMAKAAEPYADVFVKSGLPADFIDQLVAAANATVVKARRACDRTQAGTDRGAGDTSDRPSSGDPRKHSADTRRGRRVTAME